MIIIPYLFFFAAIVYLEIGLYAFRLNPKSPLNRIFLLVCFLFSVWSVDNIQFNLVQSKSTLVFFHKLFAFSWCFFSGAVLHFFLVLTKKDRLLKKWWIYLLLYLPGLLLTIQEIRGVSVARDFIKLDVGWKTVYWLDSFWYWFYQGYYILYTLGAILLTFLWGRMTGVLREKRQAGIIIAASILSLVPGFTLDTLLPTLHLRLIPPMGPFIILIWILGIWYSIVRYRLMNVTPEAASQEILSKMMDVVAILSPDMAITTVNLRMIELTGYREKELLGMPFTNLIAEKELFGKEIGNFKSNTHVNRVLKLNYLNKIGNKIPVGTSLSCIKDHQGLIAGFIVIGQDLRIMDQLDREISEKLEAQYLLEGEKANFYFLMENSPYGTIFSDKHEKVLYMNPEFIKITGYWPRDLVYMSDWFKKAYPDEKVRKAEMDLWAGSKTDQGMFYRAISTKSGEIKSIEGRKTVLDDGKIIFTIMDITERKKVEDLLRDNEERFRKLTENISAGIFIYRAEKILYVNSYTRLITGYSREEMLKLSIWDIIHPDSGYLVRERGFAHAEGKEVPNRYEIKVLQKDGGECWIDLMVGSIEYQGEKATLGTAYDITDRKIVEDALLKAGHELEIRVQERTAELEESNRKLITEIDERKKISDNLEESLKEKEILLKEIHHRVKNNLQIISSLLSLQSQSLTDQEVLSIFRDSQSRIKTIAFIHEKLYQSSNLASVDFNEYIAGLVSDLIYSYGVQAEKIRHTIDVKDIYLNIETAIPCGLIINELVSNSLKHAFPGGRDGEIRIKLARENDKTLTLSVIDDGVGMPEGLDLQKAKSLGLKLVNNLTRQLSGRLSIIHGAGTEFRITFSELIYKERK